MSGLESFIYPVCKKITYNNDNEYRTMIREIFELEEKVNVLRDMDMDDISKDELNYDDSRMKEILCWISKETRNCYELQELYKLAAATMITLDIEIGLSVLFSFDYLKDFHESLCAYFLNRSIDMDMLPCYERLVNRLSMKQ